MKAASATDDAESATDVDAPKLKKSPVGGPGTSSWVQSREDQVKEILDEKQKEARSARATDLERRQKPILSAEAAAGGNRGTPHVRS